MSSEHTFGIVDDDPDLGTDLYADLDGEPDDNDLEALRSELAEQDQVDTNVTTIQVVNRPGWALVARTDFTAKEVEALKRPARDPAFKETNGGINPGKHAALIIGQMTTGVLRHGKPVVLDGVEQTFKTKALQGLLGCAPGEGAAAAVFRMFGGKEGRVIAASDKLIEEAG